VLFFVFLFPIVGKYSNWKRRKFRVSSDEKESVRRTDIQVRERRECIIACAVCCDEWLDVYLTVCEKKKLKIEVISCRLLRGIYATIVTVCVVSSVVFVSIMGLLQPTLFHALLSVFLSVTMIIFALQV
jgi:hypothetical protein